jgi:hypothetical protein
MKPAHWATEARPVYWLNALAELAACYQELGIPDWLYSQHSMTLMFSTHRASQFSYSIST